MARDSSTGRDDSGFIGCPHCTIQVPAGTAVCPYCRLPIVAGEAVGRIREAHLPPAKSSGNRFWERYGIWIKAGGPVLLALVVLLIVYRSWSGVRIRVLPNADLPLQVEQERKGTTVVLRGTVTNRGIDVPDLSLKSIRVLVTFLYRDGRREQRTAFPKTRFRGEGALLRGETGTFELVAPSDRLDTVTFRCEVVDLGLGKTLIPSRTRRAPPRRR